MATQELPVSPSSLSQMQLMHRLKAVCSDTHAHTLLLELNYHEHGPIAPTCVSVGCANRKIHSHMPTTRSFYKLGSWKCAFL